MSEDHIAVKIDGVLYVKLEDAKKLRAELDRIARERDVALEKAGLLRMCVNCGASAPAECDRLASPPSCPSPDACSFDMTPHEAWQYWRKKYHAATAASAAAQTGEAR
jgi:hypothetical protein